jgi:hypothetical protein
LQGLRGCEGSSHAVSAKAEPHDESKENIERYANYLARAVFYNATGRPVMDW